MKKSRSPRLWEFLQERGVLDGSEEEIQSAKAAYRKMYKANWKKKSKSRRHELRPLFTEDEFLRLMSHARVYGTTPTAYIKDLALSFIGQGELIPNKVELEKILQLVSMAAISLERYKDIQFMPGTLKDQLRVQIGLAERMLLKYLDK